MSPKSPINPFHFLLGVAGVAFTVTAVGYTMVILRAEKQTWIAAGHEQAIAADAKRLPPAEHPWIKLLRADGGKILLYEIAAVAVFACAAIGLDRIRDLRKERATKSRTRGTTDAEDEQAVSVSKE